ncbi:hypothetical protein CsSME_00045046 [Camellia sinensis var. sinensis]
MQIYKVVLKLDVHDEKAKHKAMKTVTSLTGIDSIVMDMNEKKLTLIGDVDPVIVPEKKKDDKKDEEKQIEGLVKACKAYNPYMTQYYHVHSAEENPNACVIC